MPEDLAGWALALAAAVCVGLSKTAFTGLGILAVLAFAEIMPAKESTGALLPLLIAADIAGVLLYRRHANWSDLARLLPTTLAGIVCGWLLMPRIPGDTFTRWLGWLVLAGIAALVPLLCLGSDRLHRVASHRAAGYAAGWAAGLVTMMANAAGGITAFYFLSRRLDKLTFVGTAAWFFLVVNLMKVPFSVHLGFINTTSLRLDAMLLPVTLAGALAGRWVLHRVPQRMFEWVTIGLALAAALRLVAAG